MPRGNYAVQQGIDVEASKQAGRDSSYRACLHAMLIFLAICIILLVAAWPWNSNKTPATSPSNNTDAISSAAVKGDGTGAPDTTTQRTKPTTARASQTTSQNTTPKTTTTTTTTTTSEPVPERKPAYRPVPEDEAPTYPPTTQGSSQEITTINPQFERKPMYKPKADEDVPADSSTTQESGYTHPATEHPITVRPAASSKSGDDPLEPRRIAPADYTTTSTEEATITAVFQDIVAPVNTERTSETSPEPPVTEKVLVPDNDKITTGKDAEVTTLIAQVDTVKGYTERDDKQGNDESSSKSTTTESAAETQSPVAESGGAVTVQDATDSSSVSVLPNVSDVSSTSELPSSTTEETGVDKVCETSECKVLAVRMLSLMNHSVDPCDDFYEHACGGLRSNQDLLEEDPSKDVNTRIDNGLKSIGKYNSSEAHIKFKKYYDSCVNFDTLIKTERRIEEAQRLIESVGHFNDIENPKPVLDDFTTLLSNLMLHHSTPLLDVLLDVDGKNQSRFALKLTPPILKPIFRPGYRRDDCLESLGTSSHLNDLHAIYTDCRENEHGPYLLELETAINVLNITTSTRTIANVRQHVEWDLLGLIKFLPNPGDIRVAMTGKDYVEMTIAQLRNSYPVVNWKELVKTLLGRELPDDTHVQVYFKSYLDKMFNHIVTDTDGRALQNMLMAWFIHDVYVDLVMTQNSCKRQEYCLHMAKELMEDVASSLYLSSFPPKELENMRTDVQQVFTELRTTLELQLRDEKWLDEQWRSVTASKLQSLKLAVDGGVSVFLNETFLDMRMDIIDEQDKNYLTLSVALLKRYRRQMYALYDVNPSETQAMWTHFLNPFSTQGIVVYALNKVVIPFGLMKWPMYEPSQPRYQLMARLGFVIAHEMAHHFDVNGMKYYIDGKGDNFLKSYNSASFDQMTSCPKDMNTFHNGSHTADDGRVITFKANSTLSLNERLADRTGAALAYETYLAWVRDHIQPREMPYLGLTNDEVYFLAVAQIFCSKKTILDYSVDMFEEEHPPPFLRVNSLMDNSEEFSKAFECKVGLKMNPNPDVRCEVFPKISVAADDYGSTDAS